MSDDLELDKFTRFYKLGAWILQAKFIYYYAPSGISCPSDTKYDTIEEEYKELGKYFEFNHINSDMVGFNERDKACKLAMEYVLINKKIDDSLLEITND
jgi:hypothetical protein